MYACSSLLGTNIAYTILFSLMKRETIGLPQLFIITERPQRTSLGAKPYPSGNNLFSGLTLIWLSTPVKHVRYICVPIICLYSYKTQNTKTPHRLCSAVYQICPWTLHRPYIEATRLSVRQLLLDGYIKKKTEDSSTVQLGAT